MNRLLMGLAIAGTAAVAWCCIGAIHSLFTVSRPLRQADAIVLLAGSYRIRAPEAARLYHEQRAARIILTNDGVFSGWSRTYQRNLYAVEWARELLVTSGVPPEAVVPLPFIGSGTIYDALAVRSYCRRGGIRSLLLVTSDYHSRRALWTFRHLFREDGTVIGIVPVASPREGWVRDRWLSLQQVGAETVKGIYYALRFGLLRNFGLPISGSR